MTNDEIELPELPYWAFMDDLGGLVPSEVRVAVKDYARAAVRADRQRRFVKERAQLEQEWSVVKGLQDSERAQAAEPVGKIGRVEVINGRVKSYGFEQPEIPDGNYALYAGPPPPKPSGPAELLCGATRFKLSFSSRGNVSALANYRDLLDGRWVALVAAENDRHLALTTPARPAVTEGNDDE